MNDMMGVAKMKSAYSSIVAVAAVALLPIAGVAANSIQDEIDAVAAKGGGRVVVSAGEHFSDGPIRLRSNVELHLEDGAPRRRHLA